MPFPFPRATNDTVHLVVEEPRELCLCRNGRANDILEVDPAGAMAVVKGSGALLLDVREDDEWAAGHAPGAVHIRLGDLDAHALDPATPVVAVCRSGKRSALAATKLAASGVTVYNLVGGMGAWQQMGQSVIRDDGTPGTVI